MSARPQPGPDAPLVSRAPEAERDRLNLASYQVYFNSGHYDARYPGPNRAMWRRVMLLARGAEAVLDYGCGSGRYLMPLQGVVPRAAGFDVSPAALKQAGKRAREQGWCDVALLGPDTADLDAYLAREGPLDLVLCLFGVLGHMTEPDARRHALDQMRRALTPERGRMLVSVPNRRRRFRAEQRGVTNGLIQYTREMAGTRVLLNYQLYDPDSLTRELEAAGFRIHRLGCESVLPEAWLLKRPILQRMDAAMTAICPTALGYGIYAEVSC